MLYAMEASALREMLNAKAEGLDELPNKWHQRRLALMQEYAQVCAAGKTGKTPGNPRRTPTGERLDFDAPAYQKQTTPAPAPAADPDTLSQIVEALKNLTTALQQVFGTPVTPVDAGDEAKSKASRAAKLQSRAAKGLRDIADAIGAGPGRADFAIAAGRLGMTPAQAVAAINDPEVRWNHNVDGCQQAYNGKKKYFLSAWNYAAKGRQIDERRAASRIV